MEQENSQPDQQHSAAPNPRPFPSRGLMMAHIVNLLLILIVFWGTHYVLSSNQCTPETSFRWSVIAAAVYGLLSALLLSSWLHRKAK